MRILIVKLSSIGDVVHTLPAAAHLRHRLPSARLMWVVGRSAARILDGCQVIDELIPLKRGVVKSKEGQPKATSDNHEVRAGWRRRLGSPDIAIDFQGLIKSGFIAAASGARHRIGFEASELRERASSVFLTHQVSTSTVEHILEKNLALADGAIALIQGIPGHPLAESTLSVPGRGPGYEFPIFVSAADNAYVESAMSDCVNFAIINPGGGWPTKLWSEARFAEIADWLWADFNMESVVTVGPGEERMASHIANSSRSGRTRTLPTSLKQFVALARRARLFVGGDTGPLHLAAASGTPIVGLYGPTSAARNGPFDLADITVSRELWCRQGCHKRSCWHWECMDIGVGDVKEAISRRLGASARPRSISAAMDR